MSLDNMLAHNKQFVKAKQYVEYETDSLPNKRMVIFTCMESRLIELLVKALDIKNGDAKMVKNAGAIIRKPFDSIMKSILIAVFQLKAEEVIVIGHHDCGMSHINTEHLKELMVTNHISEDTLKTLAHAGIDLDEEFHGFNSVEESIVNSVQMIRQHPLLPAYVKVHGLVIDPTTGKVDVIIRDA